MSTEIKTVADYETAIKSGKNASTPAPRSARARLALPAPRRERARPARRLEAARARPARRLDAARAQVVILFTASW